MALNTKQLEKQIKKVINSGNGYGPDFKPVLKETYNLLRGINGKKKIENAYFQLGNLLIQLEDHPLALEAFEQALSLNPNDLGSATYIALLHEQAGRINKALAVYQAINEAAPENIDIVEHILSLSFSTGDYFKVFEEAQKLLSRGVNHACVYEYLSRVFHLSGNFNKALKFIKFALDSQPSNAVYVNSYIVLLSRNNHFEQLQEISDSVIDDEAISLPNKLIVAFACCRNDNIAKGRKIFARLYWSYPEDRYEILTEIALYHAEYEKQIDIANWINQYVLERDPDNLKALSNLALFAIDKDIELGLYKRALDLDPEDKQIQFNYAVSCLEHGMLEEGFKYYEARIEKNSPMLKKHIHLPETIKGKKIILWKEQGLGDQILWSWLFKFLIRDEVEATIQVDERLVNLLQLSYPMFTFTSETNIDIHMSTPVGDYDGNFPQVSLAQYYTDEIKDAQEKFHLLKESQKSHLSADVDAVRYWQGELSKLTNKNVIGVCWRSSKMNQYRHRYYLSAENIIEIFKHLDCHVLNLQYMYTEEELAILQAGLGDRFIHFENIDLKDDQYQLAALISNCDMVFSAPTAVQTLTGALGIKSLSTVETTWLGKAYNIMMPECTYLPDTVHVPEDHSVYHSYLRDFIKNKPK
ncbi:MAG: tetratricopeptide repeat protein [Enterobacterales bacterium]|nr:tetratricopeptide repeat protein [Enterobacterales bacterium]